ncbi:MAG: sigma-54-dependent Fis family transcriptional regulator [Deltaproteobacteria bacterium]|jgi:DNA-binding NtrC family response regulator|nr:sigma-54-dependent Fis family transcriptional regulator [Deltaproteobacteria bacterium]MBW2504672.1 sigma-54-dependent Fis family transcriptional regulator [Deltaproteobacteria bacterium]
MSQTVKSEKAKILIVEDEAPLRDLLVKELSRSGYLVQSAADGSEGLTRYMEESFNVVLLDVKMPDIGGVDVLKSMQEHSNVPEVIMFTGHGDIETAVQCIKLGAYDYLTKPVKLDELEMVIGKAFEKNRLRRENINLKLEMNKLDNHQIVGKSPKILEVLETVQHWGQTDEHVLVYGESGTGKELIARAVHDASSRVNRPFVTVNCGRLDAHTAESELFGHMQGAFTSANKARAGLFELADSGTLFMDEVSEMPLNVQVKMLRVLETGSFRRLGGTRDITVDVRFVFASNKKLQESVDRGEFREDLYHRINLLPINLPALRERREDILPLTLHFLSQGDRPFSQDWELSDEVMAALYAYDWPGNVRELKNTIRRACILAKEPVITPDLLPFSAPRLPVFVNRQETESALQTPLWVVEKEHIGKVLARVNGNKSKAAKILEIDRKTLYTKIERYELDS